MLVVSLMAVVIVIYPKGIYNTIVLYVLLADIARTEQWNGCSVETIGYR
jgi:hypothetical protein